MNPIQRIRNIGISAHIDSGKTTLTERMLFFSGRIHKIGDIKDGADGATMDHMELEKERGITITAAATTIDWLDHQVNIIDTPGHVDFTIEVERSLRVLDGAILVLCGVAGVQSQSLTVDRQMKRYGVPRIAFINKLDRVGADPARVVSQVEEKLGLEAVPLQIPIGLEAKHEGVIDLVDMEALYFEGENGENVVRKPIPDDLKEAAERARQGMLDSLSLYDDELMELLLEGEEPALEKMYAIIRRLTIGRDIVPVLMGSAFHNRGVQPLMDAVVRYMPSPTDRIYYVRDNENDGAEVAITADPDAETVAMAFKIVDETFGQLTYTRVYQGRIKKGGTYFNPRSKRSQRIGRMVRMHADDREDVSEAGPGDIIAIIGIDCASGDTYCDTNVNYSLENIYTPEPVISLAIEPLKNNDREKLSKALARFVHEDPTFHVASDKESNETVISGMGELHLEIYVERIRREYKVEVTTGAPKVNYREAPTREAEFNYKHKKQTGGSGQFAHVIGRLVPLPADAENDYEFENKVTGGRIPTEYISSCDKGFQTARMKGPQAGHEIIRVKMILEDGSSHPVDSSDLAFQIGSRAAFREAFLRSKPAILEPIMAVEVEMQSECQGSVIGDLSSRRGIIKSTDNRGQTTIVTADVPLATMFGYATELRSATQGRADFSMEFSHYEKAPRDVQEDVIAKAREAAAAKR
ncbi:MAG: elongation factor G [Planctomycetes bacterium]|nr:elongation factor G [Planctomycetota bacterium]